MHAILKVVFIFTGVVAASIAMLLLGITIYVANQSAERSLRSHEYGPIETAKRYVENYKIDNSKFPSKEEFQSWANKMDKQGFRYEGRGFDYAHPCGKSDYCFSFWDGEIWAAYHSSPEYGGKIILDGSFWPFLDSKTGSIAVFSFFVLLSSALAFLFFKLARAASVARK